MANRVFGPSMVQIIPCLNVVCGPHDARAVNACSFDQSADFRYFQGWVDGDRHGSTTGVIFMPAKSIRS